MIELEQVTRVFAGPSGEVVAVDRVSFRVETGTTLCLIGTSGSGKTTCLKMINRLVEPTRGRILVDGVEVRELPLLGLRRSLGYVIQGGALFPHMTVAENVALLPRLEGWERRRILARVEVLLEMVNLPPSQFAHRYPRELSGGQQQRVGVARALSLDPPHILMDEPFGALDPITRDVLQDEFLRLQRQMGKTIVMVTHDLAEAFKLGDMIALMHRGRLMQVGAPRELLEEPAGEFVAQFVQSHLQGERPGDASIAGLVEPRSGEGAEVEPLAIDVSVRDALERMCREGVERLPVVEDGRLVGTVSRQALLARI